jgi:hypothetical protein
MRIPLLLICVLLYTQTFGVVGSKLQDAASVYVNTNAMKMESCVRLESGPK